MTNAQNPSANVYAQLKKQTQSFPDKTQLSIGITNNGVRTYYGFEKRGDTLIPVRNQNKVFGLGSITKVFTAMLIGDMIQQGKMKLNDDIKKFYAFKLGKKDSVSLVSVLTHTSGLQRGPSNYSSPYTQKKLHSYLRGAMLINYDTTGKYRYSNLGFVILGDILQQVSGKTFLELLQQKILVPFKMHSTSTDPSRFKPGAIIMGRDTNGIQMKNHNFYGYQSAGALLSNATDMLSFIEHSFMKNSNYGFTMTQKVYYTMNNESSMGLGWQLHHKEGDTIYTHSGNVAGYAACLKYSGKSNRGVIVLSNLSGYSSKSVCIPLITDIFLKEE